MITGQQVNAFSAHIFLRCKHIFSVHPEGNVSPFFRSHLLQSRYLRIIEKLSDACIVRRHNVPNSVLIGDPAVLPGQHAAALVRGQFTRMGDHFIEDASGDAQIAHETV